MSSTTAPVAKPKEIHASTLQPIKKLTWEHVLILLQSGYSIRCCGSEEDAFKDMTQGPFGDSTAVAAGFPHIIANLEKLGKIEEHNDLKEVLTGRLAGVDGQNITMAYLMFNIIEANLDPKNKKARDTARQELLKTLSEYKAESRVVIAAAVYDGLEMTIKEVGKRDVTAWAFVVGNKTATDTKEYFGFGKNGKRNIPTKDFWPNTILLADTNATPEQVLAGLMMICEEIAAH